jgi:hypothetical protein
MNEEERFMAGPPELVWNKGIAALCDRRIPDEFPDGRTYSSRPKVARERQPKLPHDLISDPSAYADVRDGELIWVRLSWLKSFTQQVLPIVRSKFVLVTGDSDRSVPSELGNEARSIIGCRNVLHWFAQNYDGCMASERISPIPIGIDFHTLSERPFWGEGISSPAEQERVLRSIREGLPRLENRIPRVYADFAWQAGFGLFHYHRRHPLKGARLRQPRPQVARMMHKNVLVYCQPDPLPRNEMWRRRGEYAFVLSPHGWGLDCHRTWEALALGHIVLVPSSSLDHLYDGLPVGILKSWRDINSENLRKWLSLYGESRGIHEKLTNRYWIDKMRSTAAEKIALSPANSTLLDQAGPGA